MANYRVFGQSLVNAATGLGMEAVSQMVDGLDAFGSSKVVPIGTKTQCGS
jgi:hypothetical protein